MNDRLQQGVESSDLTGQNSANVSKNYGPITDRVLPFRTRIKASDSPAKFEHSKIWAQTLKTSDRLEMICGATYQVVALVSSVSEHEINVVRSFREEF